VAGIFLTAWGGQIRERTAPVTTQTRIASRSSDGDHAGGSVRVDGAYVELFVCFWAEYCSRRNSPWNPGGACRLRGLADGTGGRLSSEHRLRSVPSRKDRTWSSFRSFNPDFFWSFLLGALWMGAFALYGMSAIYFGSLGTSTGWGLFQIMIMTATLSGVCTGEWKHAPRLATSFFGPGLTCLTGATVLLALGNR
jgi:hypothetical protein